MRQEVSLPAAPGRSRHGMLIISPPVDAMQWEMMLDIVDTAMFPQVSMAAGAHDTVGRHKKHLRPDDTMTMTASRPWAGDTTRQLRPFRRRA